ncbi:MAG: hypothetical protein LQ345_001971 [Seirophora villosa]|nr:MAG: hypothetical protein LQ345_001971 [Seirophora villosa]
MAPPKPAILGPLQPNRFRLPVGQKQVYLYTSSPLPLFLFPTPPSLPNLPHIPNHHKTIARPNFTLTLLRTPFAPPTHATFLTPLHLNKLDVKDYLYHCYGVEALSVRSYVQQARVVRGKPGAKIPRPGFFRPRATKRMTVEMPASAPFVWPDAPNDFTPWDKEAQEKAEASREREQKAMGAEGRGMPPEDGGTLREQAARLLKGEGRWRPGAVGEGVGM